VRRHHRGAGGLHGHGELGRVLEQPGEVGPAQRAPPSRVGLFEGLARRIAHRVDHTDAPRVRSEFSRGFLGVRVTSCYLAASRTGVTPYPVMKHRLRPPVFVGGSVGPPRQRPASGLSGHHTPPLSGLGLGLFGLSAARSFISGDTASTAMLLGFHGSTHGLEPPGNPASSSRRPCRGPIGSDLRFCTFDTEPSYNPGADSVIGQHRLRPCRHIKGGFG
jgi:hypothetical protein